MANLTSLTYKLSFLRGLLSCERAPVGPYYVHVDVTHRCDLKCLCCRWHSPLMESRRNKGLNDDLPVELLDQFCQDLKALGTKEIYFVGTGEPMLHPQIFDLVATAKKYGFKLILYTNGLTLDEDAIRRLIDLRVDVLRVSLWGSTPEKFIEQVGLMTEEKFHRIIDGMALLSRMKKEFGVDLPFLELCQSVTHHNLDELGHTLELVKKTGCQKLCFSPIVDFEEDSLSKFLPDESDKEKLREIFTAMKQTLEERGIIHNVDTMLLHYSWDGRIYDRLPCYPAWYFSYLRTDGSIFACQRNNYKTTPLGNLRENRFREIWNNEAYRAFRRRVCTPEGLAADTEYYCDYCSHSYNSFRVHKRFRFFKPLQKMFVS